MVPDCEFESFLYVVLIKSMLFLLSSTIKCSTVAGGRFHSLSMSGQF